MEITKHKELRGIHGLFVGLCAAWMKKGRTKRVLGTLSVIIDITGLTAVMNGDAIHAQLS